MTVRRILLFVVAFALFMFGARTAWACTFAKPTVEIHCTNPKESTTIFVPAPDWQTEPTFLARVAQVEAECIRGVTPLLPIFFGMARSTGYGYELARESEAAHTHLDERQRELSPCAILRVNAVEGWLISYVEYGSYCVSSFFGSGEMNGCGSTITLWIPAYLLLAPLSPMRLFWTILFIGVLVGGWHIAVRTGRRYGPSAHPITLLCILMLVIIPDFLATQVVGWVLLAYLLPELMAAARPAL